MNAKSTVTKSMWEPYLNSEHPVKVWGDGDQDFDEFDWEFFVDEFESIMKFVNPEESQIQHWKTLLKLRPNSLVHLSVLRNP